MQMIARAAMRLDPVAVPLGLLALAGLALAYALAPTQGGVFALDFGVLLLAIAVGVRWIAVAQRRLLRKRVAVLESVFGRDAAACFTTTVTGRPVYMNAAAKARLGAVISAESLKEALSDSFASPAATLFRLQARARSDGSACETVTSRQRQTRISVHRLGRDGFLWRFEELAGPEWQAGAAARLPMLEVGSDGALTTLTPALRAMLGEDAPIPQRLEDLFVDLPLRAGRIAHLRAADGARRVRIAELAEPTGRREIYVLPAEDENDASGWSLADDFPVPMLKLSASGQVVTANTRARELLAPVDPEGCALADLVEGLGRSLTDWLGEAAHGEGLRQPEVVRALRGDRELYLQIRLGRLERGAGAPELVAVLSDLTELKVLEAQFVQSQKMQAIGQLAGGIAHDFNNLLTAISGHCDLLLLRHQDLADADHADLQQIAQNANRAAALVAQLLAYSRKQNLQPQVLDLREVLADHAHLLNRLVGERVRLSLQVAEDLPPVRADRRQFEQVVMNLVVNARDAMPSGGLIRVEAAVTMLAAPMRRDRATVPEGTWVVVRVRDEGAGIPPDRMDKLFEPFFTTKRPGEGTGLGLSTVYGIVKQSGGYVFVDSVIDEGSEFQVWLPAYRGPVLPAPTPAPVVPAAPAPDPRGVILLVEDEAPVRAFASRALRMRGHRVIEADSGEEALAILEDRSLQVDVFVTDLVMPRLDGPSWVKRAREVRPDARVVFISGYAEDSVAEHQARIPGSVFLAKPFSLTELTAMVARQLRRGERAPATLR